MAPLRRFVLGFWQGGRVAAGEENFRILPDGSLDLVWQLDAGAPLTLGFVLGRMMEENLRQALIISRGNLLTFVERPISACLLAAGLVLLLVAILPAIRRGREEAFSEQD